MSARETESPREDGVTQAGMDRRIKALERGIRVWRCLAATGFLTALGAFGLAVFGLSQFENTYFIGEVAAAASDAEAPPLRAGGVTTPGAFGAGELGSAPVPWEGVGLTPTPVDGVLFDASPPSVPLDPGTGSWAAMDGGS